MKKKLSYGLMLAVLVAFIAKAQDINFMDNFIWKDYATFAGPTGTPFSICWTIECDDPAGCTEVNTVQLRKYRVEGGQDFNSQVISRDAWTVKNPSGEFTWVFYTDASASPTTFITTPTSLYRVNNYGEDSNLHSSNSFPTAQLSFRVAKNQFSSVGFDEQPEESTSISNTRWHFYFNSLNSFSVRNHSVVMHSGGAWLVNDIFKMTFDGTTLRAFKNDIEIFSTVDHGFTGPVYMVVYQLYNGGGSPQLDQIEFKSLNSNPNTQYCVLEKTAMSGHWIYDATFCDKLPSEGTPQCSTITSVSETNATVDTAEGTITKPWWIYTFLGAPGTPEVDMKWWNVPRNPSDTQSKEVLVNVISN